MSATASRVDAGAKPRVVDRTLGRSQRVAAAPRSAAPTTIAPQLKICSFDGTRSRAPFATASGTLGYPHLRASLLDPAKFGPTGTVQRTVVIADGVPSITASNIADCDVFFTSVFTGGLSASEATALGARVQAGMKVIADGDSNGDEAGSVTSVLQAAGISATVIGAAACNNDTVAGGTIGPISDSATVGPFGDLRGGNFGMSLTSVVDGAAPDVTCPSPERAVIGNVMFGGDPSAFDLFTTNQPNNENFYLNFIAGGSAGIPGAPTLTGASVGNKWMSVAWDPPASSGTSAISAYVVTTSPADDTVTVPAASRRAVVTVTNGNAQVARVQAVNGSGAGLPSNASTSLTPQAVTVRETTAYSASDNTRLLKNATYFGQTAVNAQRTSVGIIAYLVGIVHPSDLTPQAPPGNSGPNSYTTPWAASDQSVLVTVMRQYGLNPSEAQYFSVLLVGYLLALGGN